MLCRAVLWSVHSPTLLAKDRSLTNVVARLHTAGQVGWAGDRKNTLPLGMQCRVVCGVLLDCRRSLCCAIAAGCFVPPLLVSPARQPGDKRLLGALLVGGGGCASASMVVRVQCNHLTYRPLGNCCGPHSVEAVKPQLLCVVCMCYAMLCYAVRYLSLPPTTTRLNEGWTVFLERKIVGRLQVSVC